MHTNEHELLVVPASSMDEEVFNVANFLIHIGYNLLM